MEPWLAWALTAIALLIGEVLTGTFYLAALALAAVIPAIAAAFGLGVGAQIGGFVIFALLSLWKGRPLLEAAIHPDSRQLSTNVAGVVGSVGHVREWLADGARTGRVAIGGDDWRAVSMDGRPIPVGKQVVVVDVQGVTLTVAPDPSDED
jgi:membrane protein implicated in regulation of membrane protease activity